MKKVNVSTKKMGMFAGKWVAIENDRIIAVGETLQEISPLVSGKAGEEEKIKAYSFKVPRKDEGPYYAPSPIEIFEEKKGYVKLK